MGSDVSQEVFNVAYHLKQDIAATWALDSVKRRQIWKSLKDQYAFEKTAKPER
jgi:hypothetical protein